MAPDLSEETNHITVKRRGNHDKTHQYRKGPCRYWPLFSAGNFLFVSGQLPIDPKTGSIDADNVADQARQSLTNLSQILEAAGTSMDKVVKTTVFIQHMDDFAVMNEVYAQFFQGEVLPARSAVEVAKLPKGALVEIEAVAAL